MKKLILIASLIFGLSMTSTSQSSVSDIYSCVNQHYSNLTLCFSTNDVTGTYRGSGSILYFQPDAGVLYTQFSPCVDNYNKDRLVCPTAPLLVIGNGEKKKKVAQ